jgi:hypothetical protein
MQNACLDLLLAFIDFGFKGDNSFAEKIITGVNYNEIFPNKALLLNEFVNRFQNSKKGKSEGSNESTHRLPFNQKNYLDLYITSHEFSGSIIFKMSFKLILMMLRIQDKGLSPFSLRFANK